MKRILQTALGRLGYRLVRVNDGPRPSEGLSPFFTSLQKLGFVPKHIMDVGANRGLWTREAIRFFPDARYTLVEPQDHLKSHIQDLLDCGCKIQWITAAAGDKSGSMPMSIAPRDDSSTLLLKDRYGKATGSRETTVEVKTLNEIAASCGTPLPDM